MAEQEDNHFVAHPEGGITTASQVEAEQATGTEVASQEVAPEVASDPVPEVAATTEEVAAPETTEAAPETTEATVEPETEPEAGE